MQARQHRRKILETPACFPLRNASLCRLWLLKAVLCQEHKDVSVSESTAGHQTLAILSGRRGGFLFLSRFDLPFAVYSFVELNDPSF